MAIDRQAVDHVARLARLALDEDERERMMGELAQILAHAEKIQELDLDAVEPTSHSLPIRNVMRPDEVRTGLTQDEALANAPAAEAGRFRVPRIIEDA
ncbi:MAG: Asp-tRNA(Asn)/Glu-tRNA(Gln) amidotransferase subunit GatC [Actinomycetota bacterium]|jgi:aspartyl-tRNA(Asn)/glutamyl-tRNA(Gln) amidotransferase subunit C